MIYMPDMQEDITIIVNPSADAPGEDSDPSISARLTDRVTPLGKYDEWDKVETDFQEWEDVKDGFDSWGDIPLRSYESDDGIDFPLFTPKHPNPLKRLWIGKCTVYEYQTLTNPTTHQSIQSLVPVLVNEPCRLSYRYEQSTNIQNGTAVVSQSITLFIRPDLMIKPGSVIEVTQHGRTTKFKGAGKPAVYTNHQELIMELADGNA